MFDKTRKNIGIATTRLFSKNKSIKQISFSGAFSRAQSALVVLPENKEHYNEVMPTLTLLRNKFQGPKLTLVAFSLDAHLSETFVHSSIVPIQNEQLGFFFLPTKKAIQTLLKQHYDVVVDLNTTIVPAAVYLCSVINAPLKVSFTKDHADVFYNFQVNISPDRNAQIHYEQLFKTLSMF